MPGNIAVDQRVGGGGGVGDDLGDHFVVVRPPVVVVRVGRKVELLSGGPLVQLVRTAAHRHGLRDRVIPDLCRIELPVDRGWRDIAEEIQRQEGSKGLGQRVLDRIGVDLLDRLQLAPVVRVIGIKLRVGLDFLGCEHIVGGDRGSIAPLGILLELHGPHQAVARDRGHTIGKVRDDIEVLVGRVEVGKEERKNTIVRNSRHDERIEGVDVGVERPDQRAAILCRAR